MYTKGKKDNFEYAKLFSITSSASLNPTINQLVVDASKSFSFLKYTVEGI